MSAECRFYILNRDNPENSHSLWVSTNTGVGLLVMESPPLVGDLIFLSGQTTDPEDDSEDPANIAVHGVWRVLTRCWAPSSYGSVNWPYGKPPPPEVLLEVMVERAEGIFADSHYGVRVELGRTET